MFIYSINFSKKNYQINIIRFIKLCNKNHKVQKLNIVALYYILYTSNFLEI